MPRVVGILLMGPTQRDDATVNLSDIQNADELDEVAHPCRTDHRKRGRHSAFSELAPVTQGDRDCGRLANRAYQTT